MSGRDPPVSPDVSRRPFPADDAIARRIARLTEIGRPDFARGSPSTSPRARSSRARASTGWSDEFELDRSSRRHAPGPAGGDAACTCRRSPGSTSERSAWRPTTGDLILGGNVEVPGVDLAQTLHGEGFVCVRAFARGTSVAALATGEARPCGHCRQTIAEFAFSRDLALIDLAGHALSMADLYPWPFEPGRPRAAGDRPRRRRLAGPGDRGQIVCRAMSPTRSSPPAGALTSHTVDARRPSCSG